MEWQQQKGIEKKSLPQTREVIDVWRGKKIFFSDHCMLGALHNPFFSEARERYEGSTVSMPEAQKSEANLPG